MTTWPATPKLALAQRRRPDPSRPSVPGEPVLALDQIQGNVIPGFNKPTQVFLFLQITEAASFKRWLGALAGYVTTGREVVWFRQERRLRERHRGLPLLEATWLNVAFSYRGLEKLSREARSFREPAFKQGLAARSELLGDPTVPRAEGHRRNWLVGGPHNEADVVVLLASDDRDDLLVDTAALEDSVRGARLIFKQEGASLRGPLSGREHFGFEDGVSQPGLRGRLSEDPTDVLTPRQNPLNRQQGRPGQDLVWPGEFVFGYPGQDPSDPDAPGALREAGPASARNGSFMVVRRLRQDVPGFQKFVRETAGTLGMAEELFAAKCVGRWRSGAPLLRAPKRDDAALAGTACANNQFEFRSRSSQLRPRDAEGPEDCTDVIPDSAPPVLFPASRGDPVGKLCPFAAHIRTVYPRDDLAPRQASPSGVERAEADVQTHRLLRRGIPFGDPYRPPRTGEGPDSGERGLIFVAFQTSFERQFEYVTREFVNNPHLQRRGAGFDPLIGQNNKPGANRRRSFRLTFTDRMGRQRTREVAMATDWVIPTGGGYFFVPSIDALYRLAGAPGRVTGNGRDATHPAGKRRHGIVPAEAAPKQPGPERFSPEGVHGRLQDLGGEV